MHWNHCGHTSPEHLHVRIGARAQDFRVRKKQLTHSEDQTATDPGNRGRESSQKSAAKEMGLLLNKNTRPENHATPYSS